MKDESERLPNSKRPTSGGAETDWQRTILHPSGDNRAEGSASLKRWAHLEILEKIGEGSYGEVYRARDPNLDREVALKLLRRWGGNLAECKPMILREGRLLARIRHPNVVTVYGTDESEGRFGLWMEFIRGRNLEDLLQDQGPLGAREASGIGLDLCRALAAIHKANLVHRDIKAHNVMREQGGRIVLMDLGLGGEQALEGSTGENVLLTGTPLYMSSELLRGGHATVRSDIYALGVTLYHLVTGSFPVVGRSVQDIIKAHEEGNIKLLRDVRPDLPATFITVVEQAISSDSNCRYRSAGQMEQALAHSERAIEASQSLAAHDRKENSAKIEGPADELPTVPGNRKRLVRRTKRLVLGAALVLVVLGLALAFALRHPALFRSQKSPFQPGRKSVAVLPFLNRGTPENDYFCDGITEDITTQLAKIGDLKVISEASALRYRNSRKGLREIGEELGVASILQGSVRKEGDWVRITGQLIDVNSEDLMWAETYDRELKDIFMIQMDVASQIAKGLQATFSQGERERIGKAPTASMDAYNLYLRGRFLLKERTLDGIEKGIQCFQQAIDIDPGYALAYVGLADSYSFLDHYSYEPSKNKLRQKMAAMKAIELDKNLAEAHLSMALVKGQEWDWAGAESEYRRSIELKPGFATAHHWYAHLLALVGRTNEAIAEMRHARELDPLSVTINSAYGWILYVARQHTQAVEQFRIALDFDPNFVPALVELGKTYVAQNDFQKGIAELKKAISLDASAEREAMLAYAYAMAGNREEAKIIRARLIELSTKGDTISPGDIAVISTGLGEVDVAFQWLNKAYEKRDVWITFLKAEPVFDKLRADKRFTELLTRAGLKAQSEGFAARTIAFTKPAGLSFRRRESCPEKG